MPALLCEERAVAELLVRDEEHEHEHEHEHEDEHEDEDERAARRADATYVGGHGRSWW